MSRKLPRSVQEVADVIGRDLALYLVGQLPRAASNGTPMLYVPKTLKPEHPLVGMLGWPAAMKLVRAFGGEILQPAHCADVYREFRDASILRLLSQGHSAKTLADWFRVCDRHVRNLVRENTQEAANEARRDTSAIA